MSWTEILLCVIAALLGAIYFAIDECRCCVREIRRREFGEAKKKEWREKWTVFQKGRGKGEQSGG